MLLYLTLVYRLFVNTSAFKLLSLKDAVFFSENAVLFGEK